MTRPNIPVEEVFDALVLEESEPNYSAVVKWCERYPEHREAIMEFFATWAVQSELQQDFAIDEDRLANLAVSYALNALHQRSGHSSPDPKDGYDTAPQRLSVAWRRADISEQELATRTGLDDTIIQKLDLRRIVDIPRICFERIASVLGTNANRIEEMATGPPLVAAVRYKAKHKPTLVTEKFDAAVQNSTLPEEAKRFWLETVEAERRRNRA